MYTSGTYTITVQQRKLKKGGSNIWKNTIEQEVWIFLIRFYNTIKHFLKHKNYGYLFYFICHLRIWGRWERKIIYAHYAYWLLPHSHVGQSELAFKLSGVVCSHHSNTITTLKRDNSREIICSFLKCTQVPKNFLSKPVWYECVIAITVTANCQLWIFSQFYRLSFCLLLQQCRILKQISRGAISSYLLCEK